MGTPADKFLPGPWFVSRDPRPDMEWNNHIASVERPHLEVCSMFHSDADGNEQGEANARLVAAAPDLLELARQYAAECGECDGTGNIGNFDTGDQHCPDCFGIRAVIAKATGSV